MIFRQNQVPHNKNLNTQEPYHKFYQSFDNQKQLFYHKDIQSQIKLNNSFKLNSTDDYSKNIINPQLLEQLKTANVLAKQNKTIKHKYLKLKQQAQQNNKYFSIQNKNLKNTINNYQNYIEKLFQTCQNLLKNSKQNQVEVGQLQKRLFQNQKKTNNNKKGKQKKDYIEDGIKRLQYLLQNKYQHYMEGDCQKDIKSQRNQQNYDDEFLKLKHQNIMVVQQNNKLIQSNNSNSLILQNLKNDYQRVYKELFTSKKQKQQLKNEFNVSNLQIQTKINMLQTQLSLQIKKREQISETYNQTKTNLSVLQKQTKKWQLEKQQYQHKLNNLEKENQIKFNQLIYKLNQYETENQILKKQKQNHTEMTFSQNIQHLEEIRKFKLLQEKYQQMKSECYNFKQQIQILNVRAQICKKQIAIKQASIDQKIQRIFNLQKEIQAKNYEKDHIHDAYSQITKQNSQLYSKCSQLQEDKENLEIQLNIKISQLNAIVDSQPPSKQTSKGNLPLQSVVLIQSKVDFLEDQLFKRIKNYHKIEKTNMETINLTDPHYQCKMRESQLIAFAEDLEIYVKYLENQIGSKNELLQNSNQSYNNEHSLAKQPSIVMNMHPTSTNLQRSQQISENIDSRNYLNQESQNPKHSPIIRLDQFQTYLWPQHISSQDIVITGTVQSGRGQSGVNPGTYLPQLKYTSNQAIKIQEDDCNQSNYLSLSPHSISLLNPQNFIIQRTYDSSLSNFQYSPSTTEKNTQKKQVSRYLFQNQDKGSKFSFNLFSQKTPQQQQAASNLKKNYNQTPDIRYYIARNQDFQFQEPHAKHKNLQSDLTFYNREDFQNGQNYKQIYQSEIKHGINVLQQISPQKSYRTQNKKSFISAVKEKIMKQSH